ncbi:hypothetical protein EC957_011413 [Mortierella hygrophila]|uniref:F-box domain-containing protein n=1 Tax=Mortierella hygrophila TaxID=979708 RepID=A0A9P6K8G8_9FUNG|nr:hypothetical protein EC957_011413 [Mortierella hygrophila]
MNAERIFDIPELLDAIAPHLPLSTLYQCVQVSKVWHTIFIPHLWRSFSENPARCRTWFHNLTNAVHARFDRPQELEWYKDVYRRHAKYIRHLTLFTPVILDACREDAFEPLAPPLSDCYTTGASGAGAGARIATMPAVSGRSLITNLESFTNEIIGLLALEIYLPKFATRTDSMNLFGTGLDYGVEATMESVAGAEETTKASRSPQTLFIEACQGLILCNPKLKTLNCGYTPWMFYGIQERLEAMGEASGGGDVGGATVFRSLKNLSIVAGNDRIPVLPPSVTRLKLIGEFGTAGALRHASQAKITNKSLEVLEMTCIESELHLQTILTQVPALKTLKILWFTIPAFSIPISSPWPLSQITVLKCQSRGGGASITVPAYPSMFQSFPLLVEYHDIMWSLALATQLAEHCPLLEVIRVTRDAVSFMSSFMSAPKVGPRQVGGPVTDCVSVLLTTLPRLRVLEMPHEMVKAENVLERPWVCLDLEEFWCQIVEIPYLTAEEEQTTQEIRRREEEGAQGSDQQHARTDEEDELMELHESCISTRKQIMAQLAKLTSLKYLSLSPDFKTRDDLSENRQGLKHVYKSLRDGRNYIRYDDVLPDTLHLRLDTGLDQLACLKKLEFLNFESIDHRLDTAEIEWMAREFPRLKETRGLVTDNYIGVEPNPKVDALIALLRRLRPDVAQRQSFGGHATTMAHTSFGFTYSNDWEKEYS